jgi:hypothetical protein
VFYAVLKNEPGSIHLASIPMDGERKEERGNWERKEGNEEN